MASECDDDRWGIVYAATSERHLKEAERSIKVVQRICSLPITLFTQFPTSVMVQVVPPASVRRDFRDKITAILGSPYSRTLFLDTDTIVLREDFIDILRLLDHFEIALAHAPGRVRRHCDSIPSSFPEFNSGVLAFHSSMRVIEVLEDWKELYEHQLSMGLRSDYDTRLGDQAPLREVLYRSQIRIATLPPEYNYRGKTNGGSANLRNVRVAHSRKLLRYAVSEEGAIDWAIAQQWFDSNNLKEPRDCL